MIVSSSSEICHSTEKLSCQVSCRCTTGKETNTNRKKQDDFYSNVLMESLTSKTYQTHCDVLLLFSHHYHAWKEKSLVDEQEHATNIGHLKKLKELRRLVLSFGSNDLKIIRKIGKRLQDDSFLQVRPGFSPNRYLSSAAKLWKPEFVEKILEDKLINKDLLKKYFAMIRPDITVSNIIFKDTLIRSKPCSYEPSDLSLPCLLSSKHKLKEKFEKEEFFLPKIDFSIFAKEVEKHERRGLFSSEEILYLPEVKTSSAHRSFNRLDLRDKSVIPGYSSLSYYVKRSLLIDLINNEKITKNNLPEGQRSYFNAQNVEACHFKEKEQTKGRKKTEKKLHENKLKPHLHPFAECDMYESATPRFVYKSTKLSSHSFETPLGKCNKKYLRFKDKDVTREANMAVHGFGVTNSTRALSGSPSLNTDVLDLSQGYVSASPDSTYSKFYTSEDIVENKEHKQCPMMKLPPLFGLTDNSQADKTHKLAEKNKVGSRKKLSENNLHMEGINAALLKDDVNVGSTHGLSEEEPRYQDRLARDSACGSLTISLSETGTWSNDLEDFTVTTFNDNEGANLHMDPIPSGRNTGGLVDFIQHAVETVLSQQNGGKDFREDVHNVKKELEIRLNKFLKADNANDFVGRTESCKGIPDSLISQCRDDSHPSSGSSTRDENKAARNLKSKRIAVVYDDELMEENVVIKSSDSSKQSHGRIKKDIGVETDIRALETDGVAIETDIGAIETDTGTIETDVVVIETDIGAVEMDVDGCGNKTKEKSIPNNKVVPSNAEVTKPFYFGGLLNEKPKAFLKKLNAGDSATNGKNAGGSAKNAGDSATNANNAGGSGTNAKNKRMKKRSQKDTRDIKLQYKEEVNNAKTVYSVIEEKEELRSYKAEISDSFRGRVSVDPIVVRRTPELISDTFVIVTEFNRGEFKVPSMHESVIEELVEMNEVGYNQMLLNNVRLNKERMEARLAEKEQRRKEIEEEKVRLSKAQKRKKQLKEELLEEEDRRKIDRGTHLEAEEKKRIYLETEKNLRESKQTRNKSKILAAKEMNKIKLKKLSDARLAELEFKKAQQALAAEIQADLIRKEREMFSRLNEEERLKYEEERQREDEQRKIEEKDREIKLLFKQQQQGVSQQIMKELDKVYAKHQQYFTTNVQRDNYFLYLNQLFSRAFTFSYQELLPFLFGDSNISKNTTNYNDDDTITLQDFSDLLFR